MATSMRAVSSRWVPLSTPERVSQGSHNDVTSPRSVSVSESGHRQALRRGEKERVSEQEAQEERNREGGKQQRRNNNEGRKFENKIMDTDAKTRTAMSGSLGTERTTLGRVGR